MVNVKARMYFEPRDIWVGIYWTKRGRYLLDVYICLVPMLPLKLTFGTCRCRECAP